MILAELEAYHSRAIAPTRRIALGRMDLPCEPAPGFGGILLGGIAARFFGDLDEDVAEDVTRLLDDIDRDRRIAQPRARHRFQEDRIGLRPCHHRLLNSADAVVFDLDEGRGTPAQHVLDAVYAARSLPRAHRSTVLGAIRRGIRWTGDLGPSLVAHLAGRGPELPAGLTVDPVLWAMEVLDLRRMGSAVAAGPPARTVVQRAFRDRLRAAHPDHGAEVDGAAQRIAELSEARRILLG